MSKSVNRLIAEDVAFEILQHPFSVDMKCDIEELVNIIHNKLEKTTAHELV